MNVNENYFTGHRSHVNEASWYVTGITNCPDPSRLVVRKFTTRSVVFVDMDTKKQYYTSLRIGNKILMAQQGLYSGPFMCVNKHSSDDRDITWIGEVVY